MDKKKQPYYCPDFTLTIVKHEDALMASNNPAVDDVDWSSDSL